LKAQAACLIQRRVRSFLQRRHREKQQEIERSERLLQEEMMKIQQEAWIARLNQIRKEDERKQRIAEEKRREQKERKAREVKFMEAAYDGEDSIVMELIAGNSDKSIPPVFVDCRSMGDGDTALSEASVAGNYSTCLVLLNAGADPDVPGRFHRSPLWRAAFMSHASVVRLLLENGADPWIGDDEGRLPRHVTQDKECLEAIDTYEDPDVRAAFVQVRQEALLKRQMELASEQEANMKELLLRIQECESSFYEAHGKLSLAIQSEALEQAAILRSDIEVWEEKWRIAKEEARELIERLGRGGGGGLDSAEVANLDSLAQLQAMEAAGELHEQGPFSALGDRILAVKELDTVLMRDVGDVLLKSQKALLLLDPSCQCAVFLRHRDCNMLNVTKFSDMQKEPVRLALLGALRFGKFLVLDLLDCNMLHVVQDVFNEIQVGLWTKILEDFHTIRSEKFYASILRESDDEAYSLLYVTPERLNRFHLIVLTSQPLVIPPSLRSSFYTLFVMLENMNIGC
jgi:hypothetical protein